MLINFEQRDYVSFLEKESKEYSSLVRPFKSNQALIRELKYKSIISKEDLSKEINILESYNVSKELHEVKNIEFSEYIDVEKDRLLNDTEVTNLIKNEIINTFYDYLYNRIVEIGIIRGLYKLDNLSFTCYRDEIRYKIIKLLKIFENDGNMEDINILCNGEFLYENQRFLNTLPNSISVDNNIKDNNIILTTEKYYLSYFIEEQDNIFRIYYDITESGIMTALIRLI